MTRSAHLLVAAIALLAAAAPAAAGVGRVLVLTENESLSSTHAGFLQDLDQVADELVVRTTSDDSLQLRQYGVWSYSGVVILSSRAALGGSIDVAELIEFADAGGNVVLATDWSASPELRELSSRLGVELEEPGARVADWYRNAGPESASSESTLASALRVLTSNALAVPRALPQGLSPSSPLVYSGTALSIPRDSSTARLVVRAEASAIVLRGSAKAGREWAAKGGAKDAPAGQAIGLVATVEARGGAGRALVVGSIQALSDAAQEAPSVSSNAAPSSASAPSCSNRPTFASLAAWALGASGKLRVASFSHRVAARAGKTAPELRPGDLSLDPASYRVGDVVAVQLALEEYEAGPKSSEGRWVPFVPSDAQLELDMLSPHVRVTLEEFAPEHGTVPATDGRGNATVVATQALALLSPDASTPPLLSAAPLFPPTLAHKALTATARVPPSPGVFRWVLRYDRPGFSRLEAEHAVTIRPFSHDEFPRFLTKATPYYASVALTGIAFVLTGALFLYTKE